MHRYRAHYSRTTLAGHRGWNWEIEDERTGLKVCWGWSGGSKRDAQVEVAEQMRRLGGKEAA